MALAGLVLAVRATAQEAAIPRPTTPAGYWDAIGSAEVVGSIHRLRGNPAEIRNSVMLFRADYIEYDEETGDIKANGNVYFKHFEKNEQIWASRLEYNTEDEKGKFYDVRGETMPRSSCAAACCPATVRSTSKGEWAERIGGKYILYNGWVTNCKLPNPWWRMKGRASKSCPANRPFRTERVPFAQNAALLYAFFLPFARKKPSQERLPGPESRAAVEARLHGRRSATTGRSTATTTPPTASRTSPPTPSPTTSISAASPASGPTSTSSSTACRIAVSRSPTTRTPPTYSGVNIYAVGRSELGNGWSARGNVNYISSFRFRQQWSESYTEAINSEIHSVGSIGKSWNSYSFNAVVARLQNFQSQRNPGHRSRRPGAADFETTR